MATVRFHLYLLAAFLACASGVSGQDQKLELDISCRRRFSNFLLTAASFKPCSGTGFGAIPELFGDTPTERLNALRKIYTNCTVVFGNVELVGLAADADLTFLQDIKEIVGYLLVTKTDMINVTLPKLVVIRSSVGGDYFGAALHVADNRNLQRLLLPNLREMSNNSVHITNNTQLCYVQSISWQSLFFEPSKQHSTLSGNGKNCASCSSTCNGECWSPNICKAVKYTCNNQDLCAGGCVSQGSSKCQVCRKKTVVGTSACCRDDQCPPPLTVFYNRCVSSPCPERFLQITSAISGTGCLPSCRSKVADYSTRTCSSKSNNFTYCSMNGSVVPLLHRDNIAALCGCHQLGGSLLIHNISFTGYPSLGIMPISRENLTCLSSLQQIDGYLAVVNTPALTDLDFLKALKRVQGTYPLYHGVYSVYISGNSDMTSLALSSLEEVIYGSVVVKENQKLCSNIAWHTLLQNPPAGVPAVTVQNTVSPSACAYNCSSHCNQSYGCWAAGPEQCLECAKYKYKRECVDKCNLNSVTQQCEACNEQCAQDRCSGSGASNCTAGCKAFRQGSLCVLNCTGAHYGKSGVCEPCNSVCRPFPTGTSGVPLTYCTGPGSYVNYASVSAVSGCYYCEKVLLRESGHKLIKPVECLLKGNACRTGYFEGREFMPNPSDQTRTIPTAACLPCDKECIACSGSSKNCSICRNVRDGKFCAAVCSSGYPDAKNVCTSTCNQLCDGCTGPTAFDCKACQVARYVNTTGGKSQCVSTCPSNKPYYTKVDKVCISSCPLETFPSLNGLCSLCHPQCNGSCKDGHANTCSSCKNFYDNTTRSCVQECPAGTYLDGPFNTTCNAIVLPQPTQATSKSDSSTIGIIAGAIVGGLVVVALVIMVVYYFHHEKKRKNAAPPILYVPDRSAEEISDIPLGLNLVDQDSLELSVELGTGCFGTVYQALWQREKQSFKCQVAVKVLHDKTLLAGSNHQNVEEIMHELSSIDHDHIIRTVCVCLVGEVMIGTQFMPYGSLLLFMDMRRRYMTPKALLTYSLQVAQGVSYLHSLSLIHGNLRAANVLVNRPDQVKICDAALIHIIPESHTKLPIQWLAPEVLHKGTFSIASDVWSFGVTMWEILTFGKVPYEEHPVGEIPQLVMSGTRLAQPKGCTVELYSLLLQAWINEANGRLDFPGILQKLEHFLEDPARYLVINLADLPLPKPRNRMASKSSVEALGGNVYESPEFAVYHGYEDIHMKDMFNAGDGLYEDPDVVQNAAYDNTANFGPKVDNPYDNANMMTNSSNMIMNPSASGHYDNTDKHVSVIIGTPEGYEDLDKEPMSQSVHSRPRDSTTFGNPSYGLMAASGYELPVDSEESKLPNDASEVQVSTKHSQKSAKPYDVPRPLQQTFSMAPPGSEFPVDSDGSNEPAIAVQSSAKRSQAAAQPYSIPRPLQQTSSKTATGQYDKPRNASTVSAPREGNDSGYENIDAPPKLLPQGQDSLDPEWSDSTYLPPSDVEGSMTTRT